MAKMETIHDVTIINFSGPRDDKCRTIHVYMKETPARYEFCDRPCIIQKVMREMVVPVDSYDHINYLDLLQTVNQNMWQRVDLDVVGEIIFDIRPILLRIRRHMAAFCIQL